MDFTRKARFVSGGHTTDTPSSITHSSVVSRGSVRLVYAIVDLNGVDVIPYNLENAYLKAMCRKKIWFKGVTKCGEDKGKVLIVVRVLYGLKSVGSSCHAALAQVFKELGFVSMLADLDIWTWEAVREDSFK